MRKYDISVVVLTYNKFDNLSKNLDSIFSQEFSNYEIIIADDGSKNFDLKHVQELCKDKENVKIIHNDKNEGTVKNYNNAIKNSTGKYIVPLSQDDSFIDNKVLNDVYSQFQITNADIVFSQFKGELNGYIYPSGNTLEIIKRNNRQELINRIFCGNIIPGCTTCYKKEYIIKNNFFDEDIKIYEDYPMIIKSILNSANISFLDRITILYGQSGVVSKHSKITEILRKDKIKIYEKLIIPNINLLKKENSKKYVKFSYNRFQKKIDLKYFDIYFLNVVLKLYAKISKYSLDEIEYKIFM